jgi:hypothetical protein
VFLMCLGFAALRNQQLTWIICLEGSTPTPGTIFQCYCKMIREVPTV